MFIFKNAFRSIMRAKGRNFLIALIVLVLSVSSCIGLSIKEANSTLKKQYANDKEITATLTQSVRNMKSQSNTISLETLQNYAKNKAVNSFGYSAAVYFSAGTGIEPLDVSGSFGQNQDFLNEHGDVQNGEKKTTSSTESATSTASSSSSSSANSSSSSATSSGSSVANTAAATTAVTATNMALSSVNTATIKYLAETNDETDTESSESAESTTSSESADTSSKSEITSSESENTVSSNSSNTQNSNEDKRPNGNADAGGASSGTASENTASGNANNANGFVKGEMPTPPTGGTSSGTSSGNSQKPQMPSGTQDGSTGSGGMRGGDTFITNQYFFNMASMMDFTLMGYNSKEALPEYVASLNLLDFDSNALNCVISETLADENSLKTGDTFTLKSPNNDDESYKFTIVGVCDTSKSGDTTNTSSNASYTDNYIYVSSKAVDKIITASAKTNASDSDEDANKLTANYSGTYTFANLTNYNEMSEAVTADGYTLYSEDVDNYEQSVEQLDTLGNYATYFLLVIFFIGAIVLIIINLFSIRDRKYEIGVLTAIGMKKRKVAAQFVIELFVITFAALIIGSGIGAAASVPVTNGLLTTINAPESTASVTSVASNTSSTKSSSSALTSSGETENAAPQAPDNADFPNQNGNKGISRFKMQTNDYIASVTSATDMSVIGQMILIGLVLTLISALSAVLFVMRYEPLKILSNRD